MSANNEKGKKEAMIWISVRESCKSFRLSSMIT